MRLKNSLDKEDSMNIYLITAKNHGGYDTYDSAVVVAESEDAARVTSPQ